MLRHDDEIRGDVCIMEAGQSERRFHEIDTSLHALTDRDPQEAVLAARALLPDETLDARNIDSLKAGNLINAGVVASDESAVNDGVDIFRRLLHEAPGRGDIQYCLANGLSAQADFVRTPRPEWYPATAKLRREARHLYWSASTNKSTSAEIAAQALTNLGNSLVKAYRFVEAYDSYLRALAFDTTNGIALTGAARILLRFAQDGTGDSGTLRVVAAQHLKKAQQHPDRIRELAGERGYQKLSKLLESKLLDVGPPDLSAASDYQQFVAKRRLALSPTIEGLDLTMHRWDSLHIESITESIDAEHGVPPIFAMFNVLKADYLAARFVAYSALNDDLPESGNYSDTLDYANYGLHSSYLALAQKSCIDLLDKVAVAASEYLGLPGSARGIYFTSRWFGERRKNDPLHWQQQIEDEIRENNTALIALSEVAGDVIEGGFLEEKRGLRHAATHRFTVLHDEGNTSDRESDYIDHFSRSVFVEQVVQALQLSRAVLFYFVDMIGIRERRVAADGRLRAPMFVSDHDWVRGRDADRSQE